MHAHTTRTHARTHLGREKRRGWRKLEHAERAAGGVTSRSADRADGHGPECKPNELPKPSCLFLAHLLEVLLAVVAAARHGGMCRGPKGGRARRSSRGRGSNRDQQQEDATDRERRGKRSRVPAGKLVRARFSGWVGADGVLVPIRAGRGAGRWPEGCFDGRFASGASSLRAPSANATAPAKPRGRARRSKQINRMINR